MGLVPGEVLAGTSYQVVREIGSGGMGVVYEVEHVRLRKRYVAKVIHEQIRGDETAPKRMEREAHVLAELNHPNIVQVHDVGTTTDGTSFFVMEKLEGTDLRQAMKSRAISPARAVQICIDVLDALAHVHERGLVHRDIKPENVFLARVPNGFITKVLDFGIVHIFDGERASQARITKTGGFIGTLYYAAPEQMAGKPAGPQNDVYACGLVLYEMLAGHGPFDDDPGVGLSRCFKPAPPLPEGGRIPPELAALVARALEQDPDKRPGAGPLASSLRQVVTQLPTDPGGRTDVDDLLDHLARNTRGDVGHLPTDLAAHTAAPDTPIMGGATPPPATPSPPTTTPSPKATAPLGTKYGMSTSAPVATTQPPHVDTSSGVSSSVASQRGPATSSRAAIFGALAVALAVLGVVGTAGITALRRITPSTTSAASAAPPAVTPAPEASPPPIPEANTAAPATSTSSGPGEPVEVVPASSVVRSAPAPASAKPNPRARSNNAEKDGYLKLDD